MSVEHHSDRPSIPDHELLRRVGRGSYGEVWLARNVVGTFRAVKVVYRASFDSERPYEREFSGLQKFEPVSRTHPGLVSILHIGRNEPGDYFYCVMEAADDATATGQIDPQTYRPRTLAGEAAKRGRLPLTECIELGVALASALGHLHSHGLVHRDIKPSNIIFVNGAPKFADIGLVTQIGTKASFVGTEGYLAPEGPGSPGADLYSLGRVLYEISLGTSQEQFPELPTGLRQWPEAEDLMRLNVIVLKACEHQAAKRFRSAEEMHAALVALQHQILGSLQGQVSRGGARAASGLSAVILSFGAAASVQIDSRPGARAASKPASIPTADSSTASAHDTLVERLAETLTEEGFIVSVETEAPLSVEWARHLEQQIRNAHLVIPVLSPDTLRSDLLAYALEVAGQASKRPSRLPLIMPLRADLKARPPRQLALALEGARDLPLPAEQWTKATLDQIVAAITSLTPNR